MIFKRFLYLPDILVRFFGLNFAVSINASNKMSQDSERLMQSYAERTGISTGDNAIISAQEKPGQPRYLWTDSFAVCNFLGLKQPEKASSLIEHVHHTLARQRKDLTKYLDGASDDHPTLGGMRIGKKMDERGPNEAFNERLEWDRDGQYFHYLTKWMVALDRAALHLGRPQLNIWARELAQAGHKGFVYSSGSAKRMYWKMSIDLSRPLVPSQGHHDPLDGLITAMELQETAKDLGIESQGPSLNNVVEDYQTMIARGGWSTTDSLGLGGLLCDALRVDQILRHGREQISSSTSQRISTCSSLLENLLQDSLSGLRGFVEREFDPSESAERRLAFRELGLSIGLAAVQRILQDKSHVVANNAKIVGLLKGFEQYMGVKKAIEEFWSKEANQRARTYKEHQDINDVMLATTFSPEGFLSLPYGHQRKPHQEL